MFGFLFPPQRTYDFIEVCGWFAARCDLILLLFDPAKLDISDEMKQVSIIYLSLHANCWSPPLLLHTCLGQCCPSQASLRAALRACS